MKKKDKNYKLYKNNKQLNKNKNRNEVMKFKENKNLKKLNFSILD